jgi:hypothetical protein
MSKKDGISENHFYYDLFKHAYNFEDYTNSTNNLATQQDLFFVCQRIGGKTTSKACTQLLLNQYT